MRVLIIFAENASSFVSVVAVCGQSGLVVLQFGPAENLAKNVSSGGVSIIGNFRKLFLSAKF